MNRCPKCDKELCTCSPWENFKVRPKPVSAMMPAEVRALTLQTMQDTIASLESALKKAHEAAQQMSTDLTEQRERAEKAERLYELAWAECEMGRSDSTHAWYPADRPDRCDCSTCQIRIAHDSARDAGRGGG